MPRDLSELANERTMSGMAGLSKTGKVGDTNNEHSLLEAIDDAGETTEEDEMGANQSRSARDLLHPYCSTLSLSDVDSCTRLEEACFPPQERATRQKVSANRHLLCYCASHPIPSLALKHWAVRSTTRPACFVPPVQLDVSIRAPLKYNQPLTHTPQIEYRLRNCGHLCMGIFTSLDEDQDPDSQAHTPTIETSNPVSSGSPKRKAVLLGHIVATMCTSPVVTDDDMSIPTPENADPKLGHKDAGSTICIHSLAVLPQYQKRGLATTLMKAYMDRMESSSIGETMSKPCQK